MEATIRMSNVFQKQVNARIIMRDIAENIVVDSPIGLEEKDGELVGFVSTEISGVQKWDNHNPYLYKTFLEIQDAEGAILEVVPYSIGFRRIEIIDKVIYLNGKRLVIVGVNRHEWNPKTGRCIGIDDMITDINCMKKNNINSVRTCHYPDQIPW